MLSRGLRVVSLRVPFYSAFTSSSSSSSSSSSLSLRSFSTAKLSVSLIKTLRDRTGAPMMECKEALTHAMTVASPDNEDQVLTEANEFLRKKGILTASKKSGRVAAEGLISTLIAAQQSGHYTGTIVEVNSETDFASRNDLFKKLTRNVTQAVAKAQTTPAALDNTQLATVSCVDPTTTNTQFPISNVLTNVVTSLRENLQVRRAAVVQGEVVGQYMHNALDEEGQERLGRHGCLVALHVNPAPTPDNTEVLSTLANKVAMHVVAAQPKYLKKADVPAEVIEKEKEVILEASKVQRHVPGEIKKEKKDKPKDEKQMQRMIDGKINKWMEENVLEEQKFVVVSEDGKQTTIANLLASEGKKLNPPVTISINSYIRFQVGEGVQQEQKVDFATEVQQKLAKK